RNHRRRACPIGVKVQSPSTRWRLRDFGSRTRIEQQPCLLLAGRIIKRNHHLEPLLAISWNSIAEKDRVFSPPAADSSSAAPSASRTQRQKRCKNAGFRGVRDGNRVCTCSPTRRDRMLFSSFSLTETNVF